MNATEAGHVYCGSLRCCRQNPGPEMTLRLMLGGGLRSHRTNDAWPVTCEACNAIVAANFRKQPLQCLSCGSEKVRPLRLKFLARGKEMHRWGHRVLTDGGYRCPKCGGFELRWDRRALLWD